MTRFLGRASALLMAAALVAVTPQVAQAAQNDSKGESKQAPLKFSRKVQPLLADAQKKQQAGDQQGALEALDKADAEPGKNADDSYMISMMRLNSAIALKDNALLEKALEGALATGRVEPEEAMKFHRNLGAIALQRNDNDKALAEFQQVLTANPNDFDLMVEVAELERKKGNDQQAIADLNKAITAKAAAGETVDESWYRRALAMAYDKNMKPEVTSASEALLKAYPSATNWRDALVIFRDGNKVDDQSNLDVLRLLRANSALSGEQDYMEYAQTAVLGGFPGEAKAVLDEGIQKGALDAGNATVKELLDGANAKIASDKASLPGLEKEAAAAKNGRAAMGTADAYLGYGDYQKAATLYKLALEKGGVDADIANTRLGFALLKAGDKAGGEQALQQVTGQPRAQLAKFYMLWGDEADA